MTHVTTVPQTQWAFLRGQNAYMRAKGFDVHAVASPGERLADLAERDGVTTHAVHISRTIEPFRDLASLYQLWRVFRRLHPTIVVVSTPKAALLGAISSWVARVPVRAFLYRGSITESASGARRVVFRFLERLTALLCHQVICVAPSLLEFAREHGILPPGKGVVLVNGMSNGIDARRFDPARADAQALAAELRVRLGLPQDALVIGYVGSLAGDKGIDDLAVAWQHLRSTIPHLHLLLVGRPEAGDPPAPSTASLLADDSRVHLPGYADDVVPYYILMDVLAFPSHREGFPNVPMEASAMGIPVVATRVVGCVDAVRDGFTGTLVPPRAPEALAEAIGRYLEDPDLRQRHGRAGRKRVVRDFAQEPIWEAMYEEYCRLLAAQGCSCPDP